MLCLIIDEQDEFVRQITELKEKTTGKDAELCRLQNELVEMKKAQAAVVSRKSPKRPPEPWKSNKNTGNTQQVRFFKLYFDFNVFSAE